MGHIDAREGRVAILSSSNMIENAFLLSQSDPVANSRYFLDLIEVLCADRRLLEIGSAKEEAVRLRLLKEVFEGIEGHFLIRYYASEEMPPPMKDLRQKTLEALKNMKAVLGERIAWEVVDPQARGKELSRERSNEYLRAKGKGLTPKEPAPKVNLEELFSGKQQKTDPEIAAERRTKAEAMASRTGKSLEECTRGLLDEEFQAAYLRDLELKGVREIPLSLRDSQAERGKSWRFYSSIDVSRAGKEPEMIEVHYQYQAKGLDYEVARLAVKLSRTAKPRILLFHGGKHVGGSSRTRAAEAPEWDPQEYGVLKWLEEKESYEMEETELKEGSSLEEVLWKRSNGASEARVSCFILIQPRDLEERQACEISRAVSEGIPTIFLVSRWRIDASEKGRQAGFPLREVTSGLDDLFGSWGITLGKEIVASRPGPPFAPPKEGSGGGLIGPFSTSMPILVKTAADSLRARHPAEKNLLPLRFPCAVALAIDDAKLRGAGLRLTELANSGSASYTVSLPTTLPSKEESALSVMKIRDLYDRNARKGGFDGPLPLAILLEGKFR